VLSFLLALAQQLLYLIVLVQNHNASESYYIFSEL